MRLRLPTATQLRTFLPLLVVTAALLVPAAAARASEAELVPPNLSNPHNDPHQMFFHLTGKQLLTVGLAVAALGIVFGLVIYAQLKRLPVHRAMGEVSDLIYECWTNQTNPANPSAESVQSALVRLKWQVVTNSTSSLPFDFCISNIRALRK